MIRAVLLLSALAYGQDGSGVDVHVTLERLRNAQWTAVDPHLVLRGGDDVRFRFRSSRAGFLYVVNHDGTGHDTWIFPSPDSGEQNTIEPNKDYLIPSNAGVFQIAARPGFETTYWILSPEELRSRKSLPAAAVKSDETPLLPRCGSGPLVARGSCSDENAGAHRTDAAAMPKLFENQSTLVARDLDVDNNGPKSRIRAARVFDAPLIYEFRIAHQ